MLNDFQQRIYDEISGSGLLGHEQAELMGGKIVFPVCDGFVQMDIPEARDRFVLTRSTAPNGAMTECDIRRAVALVSALADARDGKPVHHMGRVMA